MKTNNVAYAEARGLFVSSATEGVFGEASAVGGVLGSASATEGDLVAASAIGGVLVSSSLGPEILELGVASSAETSLFSSRSVRRGDISLVTGAVTGEGSSGGGEGGVEGGEMESILETPVELVKG